MGPLLVEMQKISRSSGLPHKNFMPVPLSRAQTKKE